VHFDWFFSGQMIAILESEMFYVQKNILVPRLSQGSDAFAGEPTTKKRYTLEGQAIDCDCDVVHDCILQIHALELQRVDVVVKKTISRVRMNGFTKCKSRL